jgi:N-acetylglucosamine-6-phosphate deacetylase
LILAGRIVSEGRCSSGWLEVAGERIVNAGEGSPPRRADELPEGLLAPGLVDLQVNGAVGREVTGGHEALEAIDRFQLSHGITSYLPTIITTDTATAERALGEIAERADDPASPVAGAHLEGPFLNPERRGVHRAELLMVPSEGVPRYYERPAVRLVTLAPELPGALALIKAIVKRGGTVSVGHSASEPPTLESAVKAGATQVTHLFNAMSRFHHRNPSLPGWALTHDDLLVGVIADGAHISADALALVRRAAGDRVILTSDSSVVAGASSGKHAQAGVTVHRDDDGRAVVEDGSLAGSVMALDECVRCWMSASGASLPEALQAASDRPASAIGLEVGLKPGTFADLLVLREDGTVRRAMRHGRWIS